MVQLCAAAPLCLLTGSNYSVPEIASYLFFPLLPVFLRVSTMFALKSIPPSEACVDDSLS